MTDKLSNKKVIELFRKYEKDIFDKLCERAVENGYEIGKLDKVNLLDEMFCMMNEDDFMDNVIENLEDSIGVEEYGFICDDDE